VVEAAVAARRPGVGASIEPFGGRVGNFTTPRAGSSRARLKEAQMRIKPANFILKPFMG
jgi:hypothetical protein